MEVLVDIGCGQTLLMQVEGSSLAEGLQVECIHVDVKDYSMVLVWLRGGFQLCSGGSTPVGLSGVTRKGLPCTSSTVTGTHHKGC